MTDEEIICVSRNTVVAIPITLTANFYIRLVIESVVLPFLVTISEGIFEQDNARPHAITITQRATHCLRRRDQQIFLPMEHWKKGHIWNIGHF